MKPEEKTEKDKSKDKKDHKNHNNEKKKIDKDKTQLSAPGAKDPRPPLHGPPSAADKDSKAGHHPPPKATSPAHRDPSAGLPPPPSPKPHSFQHPDPILVQPIPPKSQIPQHPDPILVHSTPSDSAADEDYKAGHHPPPKAPSSAHPATIPVQPTPPKPPSSQHPDPIIVHSTQIVGSTPKPPAKEPTPSKEPTPAKEPTHDKEQAPDEEPTPEKEPTHDKEPSPAEDPDDEPTPDKEPVSTDQAQVVIIPARESSSTFSQASQPVADSHEAPSATTASPVPGIDALQAVAAPEPTIQPRRGGLIGCDEAISARLAIWAVSGHGKALMKLIARATHAMSWIIWIPLILLSTHQASLREQLVNLYRGVLYASIVVMILRLICKRQRPIIPGKGPPPTNISAFDLYSFPSGSSALGMLASRFLTANYSDGVVTIVAVVIVLLIALSVLSRGRHYVLDVLGGWVIGLVIFCISKRTWIPAERCDRLMRGIQEALHI